MAVSHQGGLCYPSQKDLEQGPTPLEDLDLIVDCHTFESSACLNKRSHNELIQKLPPVDEFVEELVAGYDGLEEEFVEDFDRLKVSPLQAHYLQVHCCEQFVCYQAPAGEILVEVRLVINAVDDD